MIFKKFLEKKSFVAQNMFGERDGVISINDLGEWAWIGFKRSVIELDFPLLFTYWKSCDFASQKEEKLLFDMAFACLGKKEIQKRLKELKS